VMKQAAELLEEALKEAGGSMDEVGTNPLFEKSKPPPVVAASAGLVVVVASPAPRRPTRSADVVSADLVERRWRACWIFIHGC